MIIYLIRHKDNDDLYWSPEVGWVRLHGACIYTTPTVNVRVPLDGRWVKFRLLNSEEDESVVEVLKGCVHDVKMSAVRVGCDPKHGLSEEWWPSIVKAEKVLKDVFEE